MLSLYDTARAEHYRFSLAKGAAFRFYVCGPTVYEVPHLGHARSLVVYDLLRRLLERLGLEVVHVSNVTDIDDKIIERAKQQGRSPQEVADYYEGLWWSAADALGTLRPHFTPHATAYIPQMIEIISELVAKGYAYEAEDGVYFSVGELASYGSLSHQSREQLIAGARIEASQTKRDPADFALWKLSRVGEPYWESPFGRGRPGWHTECVAMSLDLLGEDFELHAGGSDLIFPHHENELAQAQALGKRFARSWMHHGHVTLAGEKMSRSTGNFVTLQDALASFEARELRWAILSAHYRQPMDLSPSRLEQAREALGGLDAVVRRVLSSDGGAIPQPDPEIVAAWERALLDDLDTPAACATIFEARRLANSAADRGDVPTAEAAAAAVLQCCGAMGVELKGALAPPPQVAELADERERSRREKDFARADQLREEIYSLGWLIEDTPTGPRLRRAP